MILVVDTSVAIKWYVAEEGRDQARAILTGRDETTAPEFIAVELANVFWKKVRRGEMSADMVEEALGGFDQYFGRLISQRDILPRATDLALELDHPIYDCLYLACAELVHGGLVTADRRLIEKVADTPWRSRVFALDNIRPLEPSGLKITAEALAEIVELVDRWKTVEKQTREQAEGEGIGEIRFRPAANYWQNPLSMPYRALSERLEAFSEFERIELMALSWFGYVSDSQPWPIHLRNAEANALQEPLLRNYDYFISTLICLPDGYARYLTEVADTR